MNNANLFYAIIGIATVIVLFVANDKRNRKELAKFHHQQDTTANYNKLDSLILYHN